MEKVVILGAGLSGLSAAYHLRENYEIFEKEEKVGGLCRSIKVDGFLFDYGPHILFPKDKYVSQFIKKLLGENLFIQSREAWIYHDFCDVYTRFPFQSHCSISHAAGIFSCVPKTGKVGNPGNCLRMVFIIVFSKTGFLKKLPALPNLSGSGRFLFLS